MTASTPRNPVVSVVLPVKNGASTLAEQLDALYGQDLAEPWELIVVDNASTDGTAEVIDRWKDRFEMFRCLISHEAGGAGVIRNEGTKDARAPLIAYCDADDVVSRAWLRGIVGALAHNDLATGPRDLVKLNPPNVHRWRRPTSEEIPRWKGYLPELSSSNLGVRRDAFDRVGGFDGFIRMGQDNDFGWRVQLSGGTIGFSPEAIVHYRMRPGWSYFGRYVAYGIGQVQQYQRYRSQGMPRRPWVGAARLVASLACTPIALVPSQRYRWMTNAAISLGRLRGSIRYRVVYL